MNEQPLDVSLWFVNDYYVNEFIRVRPDLSHAQRPTRSHSTLQ